MDEGIFSGTKNRVLQILARYAPGAKTWRVRLHRWRGVHIGEGTFIGTDALIDTSNPQLVWIGERVAIGIRSVIVAHFRDEELKHGADVSVRIEDDAFIGPGVIILPNVTIGHGAVVNAGSVVTRNVPPLTVVQGNPAAPIAHCSVPLGLTTPLKEYYRGLRPIKKKR